MTGIDFERLARELTDQGLLIEAGFLGLRKAAIDLDAPQKQIDDMRMAFFAGAQHLFASLITMLDPGDEVTAKDEERIELIDKELQAFGRDFEMRHIKTRGNA